MLAKRANRGSMRQTCLCRYASYKATPVATLTFKQLADAGVWCVGTALTPEAKPIYDLNLTGALAIVMGAEGSGMRRLTREHCDSLANEIGRAHV